MGKVPVCLVVAMAGNRVIGNKGALPWRLTEDLRRFKALTLGKPCIMGRKTWESLPRKPLPGRRNIVLTHEPSFHPEGATVVHSLEDALRAAGRDNPDAIMVIGGEAVFAATLPVADRIYLTEIVAAVEGDTSMPPIDGAQWRETAREGPFESGALRYAFVTLERR